MSCVCLQASRPVREVLPGVHCDAVMGSIGWQQNGLGVGVQALGHTDLESNLYHLLAV